MRRAPSCVCCSQALKSWLNTRYNLPVSTRRAKVVACGCNWKGREQTGNAPYRRAFVCWPYMIPSREIKKSPARKCRAFCQLKNRLRSLDVGGLLAFRTLYYFKGDLLAFFE